MMDEERYLELLEEIFDKMYEMQKEVIYSHKGLQAVMNLFREFSQEPVRRDPRDPVYQQAKGILENLVNSIRELYETLVSVSPPRSWQLFHEVFSKSLKLQLEGYEEMLMAFEDGNVEHIRLGSYKVDQGLKLLEASEEDNR